MIPVIAICKVPAGGEEPQPRCACRVQRHGRVRIEYTLYRRDTKETFSPIPRAGHRVARTLPPEATAVPRPRLRPERSPMAGRNRNAPVDVGQAMNRQDNAVAELF